MRSLRSVPALAAAVFALSALFVATPATAVSNRIFMSTNGNNASDCANPLTPCLTFAGALAQVNPGGEVIAEATGGYGPLNITQAVTISGPPGVVIYSGLQVSVNAPNADVVLRGLTIDGTGAAANGINVVAVGSLLVDSCVITGFTGGGVSHGTGIFFGSPGTLFVKDSLVRKNAQVGIWVFPSSGTSTVSIDNCRLDGNLIGVLAEDDSGSSRTTIRNSVVLNNFQAGLGAEQQAELNIENCSVINNGTGVLIADAGTVIRVSATAITDNSIGVFGTAGSLLSRGNNTVQGNATKGAFTGTFGGD